MPSRCLERAGHAVAFIGAIGRMVDVALFELGCERPRRVAGAIVGSRPGFSRDVGATDSEGAQQGVDLCGAASQLEQRGGTFATCLLGCRDSGFTQ